MPHKLARYLGSAALIIVLSGLRNLHATEQRRGGSELSANEGHDRERPDDQDKRPVEVSSKMEPQFVLSWTFIRDSLPLIGFLLLPSFALRALIVARFDPTVAAALLQFTQPVNFVLFVLLEVLPYYIYAIGLAVLFRSGRRYPGRTMSDSFLSITPAMLSYLFCLVCSVPITMELIFPVYPPLITYLVGLPAGAFFGGVLLSKREMRESLDQVLHSAGKREEYNSDRRAMDVRRPYWFVLVFILVLTAPSSHMWLAPEMLTIRGIPRTEYVLQQQDQDLIIYDWDMHAVLRVPKADVSYRQFCNRRYLKVSESLFGLPEGRPMCP